MVNSKIAVITGAGSGIGRDSALVLLEDGWTAVLAGRRKNMLEETARLWLLTKPSPLTPAQIDELRTHFGARW